MAAESTPRVNARYLEEFVGQTVRIVGKVTALHGNTATVDAEGSITISLNVVRPDARFFHCRAQSCLPQTRTLTEPGLAPTGLAFGAREWR